MKFQDKYYQLNTFDNMEWGSWSDDIKAAFLEWVDKNPEGLPMTRKDLDNYLKDRTW